MSARTVIIPGISGLVGSHLARRIQGKYHTIGVGRKNIESDDNVIAFPDGFTKNDNFRDWLEKVDFDIIINCAAMADVDRCETDREEAHRINVEFVEDIAHICKKRDRLLIQISTDYLFDGQSGPYPEDAVPNPINYYGQTKLMAEQAIVSSGCQHIIARTNHLYGRTGSNPSKLLGWLYGARTQEINAAGDQYNNPTWAGNLAEAIIEMIETGFRGVMNIGGPDYLSRYDFALVGAEVFGLDKRNINKVSISGLGMAAPRPLKAGLIIDKMKKLLKTPPVGVLEGLTMVRNQIL